MCIQIYIYIYIYILFMSPRCADRLTADGLGPHIYIHIVDGTRVSVLILMVSSKLVMDVISCN